MSLDAEIVAHALEGELWVAKDLTIDVHGQPSWVDGRPILAQDFAEVDEQGRRRMYRRLDKDWYVWLYQATTRAITLKAEQGELVAELKARFNALWLVAVRWWGAAEVARLQREHRLDARYQPPTYVPRLTRSIEPLAMVRP